MDGIAAGCRGGDPNRVFDVGNRWQSEVSGRGGAARARRDERENDRKTMELEFLRHPCPHSEVFKCIGRGD